jgi:hypothetical protein
MGTDGEVLKLKPGTNPPGEVILPAPERRGLIQEMARRGVPVIHLLYVRGLAERYGLPWDPIPLPSPANGRLVRSDRPAGGEFAVLLIYLAGAALLLAGAARSRAFAGL